MTPDNMNLEDLKRAWRSMGHNLGMQLPDDDSENLRNKRTALDRLCNYYRRFQILGILFAVSSFLTFSHWPLISKGKGLWLAIAYAIYFLTNYCLDWWLWKGIRSIDPLTMGAAQVSEKALFYRKRHLQMIACMIPVAIALLCFTAYMFSADKYIIAGMITGAVFGLILGINQLGKFMASYRRLSQ